MDLNSLILFFSAEQPRRIRVIENILVGHKTVSTLFWGMRYHILTYLGLSSQLDIKADHTHLKQLIKLGFLKPVMNDQYVLTRVGVTEVQQIRSHYYLPHHLNINLNYDIQRFRNRLLLAVQIVSEFSYHNTKYYPIQIDFRDALFVKKWFHFNKHRHLNLKLNHLIMKTLNRFSTSVAWQIASTFVGHQETGTTSVQQSLRLKKSQFELNLISWDVFGLILKQILVNDDPILLQLLSGLNRSLISKSALNTFKMTHQFTIQEIAYKRGIKISTVQEHLLEAAIFIPKTKFPFKLFLPSKTVLLLKHHYYENVDKWQYQRVQNCVSFFDFRLYQIFRSKCNEKLS